VSHQRANLLRAGQDEVTGTFVVGYISADGEWTVVVVPEATGQLSIVRDDNDDEIRGDALRPVRSFDVLWSFLTQFTTWGRWTMYRSNDPVSRGRANIGAAIQRIKEILP
jgi:hypothetical protein